MVKYDLIVVGGGLSGVAAAISASREGLSVLLIESEGCLGGAMMSQLVYPFMPFTVKDSISGKERAVCDGLFRKMCESTAKYEDYDNGFSAYYRKEYFKMVLDDMVCDMNVDVLFHTTMYDVIKKDRKIIGIKITNTEGNSEIFADYFIDATGDGNLIALAGCAYQLGRDSDNLCQPMTTCFAVCGVDVNQFVSDRPMLQEKYTEWQKNGKITNPRENILAFTGSGNGVIHFNTTRVVKHDPTSAADVTKAEMIARKQICEMMRFLRENSTAFKNSTLINSASHIGVRESRKLIGEYVLTGEDLINCVDFPDTVALGCYCIDIHNPEGTGTVIHKLKPGEYYKIPYRSLLPKEYDNLLVAGRCLSANQEAHSAVRIMPICCCMGEAAGTAIGVAVNTGKNTHTLDVASVREKLRSYGAAVD